MNEKETKKVDSGNGCHMGKGTCESRKGTRVIVLVYEVASWQEEG